MRRSKEEADATRADILDAAEQLFAHQGIARSRLEDIAKRAGVTRGAIYWHFKNKEEIINAMIDRVVTPAEAALEALFASPAPNAISLERFMAAIIDSFSRLREGGSAEQVTRFMLRYSLCSETQSIADTLNRERQASLDRLQRFVEQAQAGEMLSRELSARRIAVHIRAQLVGIYHQFLTDPHCYESDGEVEQSLRLLFKGLGWREG